MPRGLKWLGWLLVAALLLVGSGYLVLAGIQTVQGPVSAEVAAASIRIIGVVTSLLWLLGYAFLLFYLLRGLWQHRTVFGSTPSVRLLGLAVVTILFGKAVVALVSAPVFFAARLMGRFSSILSAKMTASFDASSLSSARFSDLITSQLQEQIAAVTNETASMLSGLPVKEIILVLGLWAALGALFRGPALTKDGKDAGLRAWWASREEPQRVAYTLTAILTVGAYLSIAAIIAIPWLVYDQDDVALSKERVERQLNGTQIVEASLPTLAVDTIQIWSRLAGLRDYLDTVDSVIDTAKAAAARKPEWKGQVTSVRSEIDQIEPEIRAALAGAASRRQDLLSAQQERISRALESYDRETSYQMAPAERVAYLRELNRWLSGGVSDALREWSTLSLYFRRMEADTHEWIVDRRSSMGELAGLFATQPAEGTIVNLPIGWSLRPPPSFTYLTLPLSAAPRGDSEPRPPDPGSAWGPFGWIAKWLLGTRSVALAQIAGMLGFGLIGAAIGVFARKDAPERNAARPYGQIAAVAVQGFAATLVVFLAVNGGLAVLSQSGSEPNSYVLFFLCLVGAIYSDDVWLWAQKKMRETLLGGKEEEPEEEVVLKSSKETSVVVPAGGGHGTSSASDRESIPGVDTDEEAATEVTEDQEPEPEVDAEEEPGGPPEKE